MRIFFFFVISWPIRTITQCMDCSVLLTGDIHLAIFRVSKLKPTVEAPEESEVETETSTNQTT